MGNELAINPKTIYSELQKQKAQMEAALPKHMTADRMARIAYTQLRTTPKLFSCTFDSFMACIMGAATLGLEPGVNGQCYLIPYEDRRKGITVCTLVPGWKGLIDLVSRSGRASAWTGVVRKEDFFEYRLGSSPKLEHEPGDDDLGNFTHVYAVGWVKDAQWPIIEVWSRAKVVKHLNQYNKVGDRHYALQNENNLEMYGRKVALLQVIKYLPSSIELRDATALEHNALEGKQNLTIDGVLTSGGMIPDGPDEKAVEAEGMMEQLGWDDNKRQMFRDNYSQKIADGLAYLKSEQQRASRGTQQHPATEKATTAPVASSAPAQGQQEQAPQQQTTTRRRGGNRQQTEAPAATQTQEDDSTSPSTAQQTESGSPDGTPAQSDQLFQEAGSEHPAVASAKKEWF
jgi:recombination protein RecT